MKRWLAASAAVLVLGALLWWVRDTAEQPASEVDAPSQDERQRLERTGYLSPEVVKDTSLDATDEPETVPGKALLAAAEMSGLGVIRCRLPADLPDEVEVSSHLRRVLWTETGLEASVEVERGLANVTPARPPNTLLMEDADAWRAQLEASTVPLGTLEWDGAWPGEVGTCRFVETPRIVLSGRVVTADGQPADPEDAWLNGCANGSTYLAEDGTFEIETWRGPPCRLSVRSGGIPGSGLMVERDADQSNIVVVDDDPEAAELMALALEEVERLEDMADPLEAAAQDADPETAALLRQWAAEDRELLEQKRQHYELAEEVFRTIPEADE